MTLPDEFVDALADAVTERIIARLPASQRESPWKTMDEAIEYTRIPEGTFRKLCASGAVPSHGGRRKVFHVDELDAALGYARAESAGGPPAPLRRAS
jgi:hypothetical protein